MCSLCNDDMSDTSDQEWVNNHYGLNTCDYLEEVGDADDFINNAEYSAAAFWDSMEA